MLTNQLSNLQHKGFTGNLFRFSLEDLTKLAGIKVFANRKNEMVKALNTYLTNPENIREIWSGLPDFDKAFVLDIIVNHGYQHEENLDRLAKKYKKSKAKRAYYDQYNTKGGYFNKDSKVALFFVDGLMPENIQQVLSAYLPPESYLFLQSQVKSKDLKDLHIFQSQEDLEKDLVNIVKLVGTDKLKVTKTNNDLTKGAIKKINDELLYKEYETHYYGMNTIKRGQDSIKIYGLYQMLVDASVVDVEEGGLILGRDANQFLAESMTDKMKRLYEAYTESVYINEAERIKERKFHVGYTPDISQVRKNFAELIAKAPIGEWIDIEVLAEDLFRNNRIFLRDYLEHVVVLQKNGSPSHDEYTWDELERRVLDVMLIEYLHPLGIVDLAIEDDQIEGEYSFQDEDILVAKYFKLTPLGAHLLGVNENYEDPSLKDKVINALWVDDNLNIVLSESTKRYQHEIFFDRVGQRVEGEEQTVYAINFQMAVKALEEKVSLDEIYNYLEKQCTQPLPAILKQVFAQWKKDQEKIRIRTVTVIESDDPEVIKELLTMNGVTKHMVKPLDSTIEIPSDTAYKVKKELEKQNYFCQIRL